MHILITNDDGIKSDGLKALVNILSREHELFVIAPDRERSATGHSLTLHKPLRLSKVDMGTPNTSAWETTGTPADCIKLAICSLVKDKPVDLIITGINHGPNLGADILYSGTVSAAIEGAIYNIPSIAISLTDGHKETANFERPALFLLEFIRELPNFKLAKQTVININYKSSTEPKISNIKIAHLGKRMYCDCYEERFDPRGRSYFWLCGEPIEDGEAPGSDVMAIKDGFVSVTPIHIKLTDLEMHASLTSYFNGKK